LDDVIGAGDIDTDRHLDDWTASVAGDLRDTLLSGGVNTWSLGWTSGRVGFDNAAALLADSATAKTHGEFEIWNVSFSRLQRLSASNSLYLTLSGQWSNANLDPAEKMVAGGPFTVRAYDMGALSGDTGVLASAEFRHDLLMLGTRTQQCNLKWRRRRTQLDGPMAIERQGLYRRADWRHTRADRPQQLGAGLVGDQQGLLKSSRRGCARTGG
jgi:hemolysin activation/secretion protein